jgi:uncharacterized protein YqhQ
VVFVLLGTPPLWVRLIERIILIPVIAAFAYEVLRLGQAYIDHPVFGLIYKPNIWLQRLTTNDPDDAQIEVAITALQHALALGEQVEAEVPAADLKAEEPLA